RLAVLSSFLGAACFMLGGFVVCRLQYPTILAVCVWLPLMCWLVERLWQRPNSFNTALLALAFGVQLLAGHLQMSAMNALLLGGFALLRSLPEECHPPHRDGSATVSRATLSRRWMLFLCGLCLGALLAAPQILPALGTLRESTRAQVDYQFLSIYSLPPWQMTMFLLPASFGHPSFDNYWGEGNYYELCGYLGVLPLILALVGAFQRSNLPTCQRASAPTCQRLRWYFIIFALIGLLLAFGRYTPLHAWLSHLPGFGAFKGPGRFLFLVAFCGSGLAALGAEGALVARRRVKPIALALCGRIVAALTVLLAVLVTVLLLAQAAVMAWMESALRRQFGRIGVKLTMGDFGVVAQQFHQTVSADAVRVLLLLLVLLVALRRVPQWGGGICVFVLIADLLPFGWRTMPTTEARFYEQTPVLVAPLRRDPTTFRVLTRPNVIVRAWSSQYVSFNGFGDTSLEHLNGWTDLMAPNLNMPFGVMSVEGYDPLRPARWHALLMRAQDRLNANPNDTKLLDLLNVKYAITLNKTELENAPAWRRAWNGRPLLYENKNVLPRAWFVRQVKSVATWERARRFMDRAEFEPQKMAVVEGARVEFMGSWVHGVITWWTGDYEVRPNRLALRCSTSQAAFLVLSEAWFSGWRAALNGEPQPLWRTNGVLRGMSLPAGQHTVTMTYAPTEFSVGCFLAMMGMATVVAMALAAGKAASQPLKASPTSIEIIKLGTPSP
ncbi:MAG: YfhO family protein, partial [Abditibacteriales bacterium]|nr:YfhO family protein [Abditibacteriales bacterium]MDW8365259.1 YfhO family protein [Abditibacteriales bacterium]